MSVTDEYINDQAVGDVTSSGFGGVPHSSLPGMRTILPFIFVFVPLSRHVLHTRISRSRPREGTIFSSLRTRK